MQPSLLQQGVELMLFGMGTVFAFLACLVIVTTLMSKLLQRLAPAQETPAFIPPAAAQQDDQLLAVISAAVHKYRSRRKP